MDLLHPLAGRRRAATLRRHVVVVTLALVLGACATGGDDAEVAAVGSTSSTGAQGLVMEVHRSELCDCCGGYTDYLTEHGVEVTEVIVEDPVAVKTSVGIPSDLFSCHTTFVEGYAVEGHVPIEVVLDLLEERPAVDAIALAGMPAGSPGMGGEKAGAWTIHAVTNGYASFHTTW